MTDDSPVKFQAFSMRFTHLVLIINFFFLISLKFGQNTANSINLTYLLFKKLLQHF